MNQTKLVNNSMSTAWMGMLAMGLAALAWGAPTGPFSPCYGKFFLAAGSGEEGHKDGYFLDADFKQPAGLALSRDQNTLYVADAGNHDLRAVALEHTDLTDFVVRHAIRAAKGVIEGAEQVQLSQRDSLRVLDLLENPPGPNARLLAAARKLPRRP